MTHRIRPIEADLPNHKLPPHKNTTSHGPAHQALAQATPRPDAHALARLTPSRVLHLQRTLGNSAVVNLLKNKQFYTSPNSIQCMYLHEETGLEISDEQYERLMELIQRYDVGVMSDFAKGKADDDVALSEEARIGVALSELNSYINEQWPRRAQRFAWQFVSAKDKKGSFNFLELLEQCVKGQQCNNVLAERLRLCLQTFTHIEESEESED